MENYEHLLSVQNLHTSFFTDNGEVQAVNGVSFNLDAGKVLGVVGESGSGKSVTAYSIMQILAETGKIMEGHILYKGEDLTTWNESQMREFRGKCCPIIFQDPMTSLDPTMTIGKQIMEPMFEHYHLSKAEAKAKALELIKEVGIDNPDKRFAQYPHELSGGMRQRVVIAIALACDPDILICDEPTTPLDVTIQAKILELIKELQDKKGISVIYITHDLGVVAKVADYVAVMYAGRIVEKGRIDEVFYDPRHPYTWGLLSSMPDTDTNSSRLYAIPGTPPNMIYPPVGDAFALRSKYAMEIDFKKEPPFFKISDTHYAATWLLDPRAPKVEMPKIVKTRIENSLKNKKGGK